MVPPAGMMATAETVPRIEGARALGGEHTGAATGFRCLVEEQPTFLVPQRLVRENSRRRGTPLVVNPRVWFSWGGEPPAEIARWLGTFQDSQPERDTAWVTDGATGALLPFWLEPA